jgi:hypothetical protein
MSQSSSLGIEFACELLHALVFRKAGDVQLLDAAVARGENGPVQKLGADAVALPAPARCPRQLRLDPRSGRNRRSSAAPRRISSARKP